MLDTPQTKEFFFQLMQDNRDTLYQMKLEYLALQIKNEEVQQLFKDVKNKVLQEHEFYAIPEKAESYGKRGSKPTVSRITDCGDIWLMDKQNFKKFQALCTIENCKRGLTDENSYIKEEYQTDIQLIKHKREMLKLFISFMPVKMQETFNKNLLRVTVQDRLIELLMRV